MPLASQILHNLGTVLRERGLTGKEARSALESGKVWLQATPLMNLGREVDPEQVRVEPNRPRSHPERDPAVVHRDPRFCVVYKPSGCLSVPAPGRREVSVVRAVERWFGSAFAVHRIDEGTSGLMMVALDEPTQLRLKAALEVHDIERSYLALVRGSFPEGPLTVRNELIRDRGDGRRGSGIGPDAKAAVTHLRRLEQSSGLSLVQATLETGRTHQVRIHLSELGFPILGDDLYGRARGGRLALHAHVLGLRHPWTGQALRFVSPLPCDLDAAKNPRPPENPVATRGPPRVRPGERRR